MKIILDFVTNSSETDYYDCDCDCNCDDCGYYDCSDDCSNCDCDYEELFPDDDDDEEEDGNIEYDCYYDDCGSRTINNCDCSNDCNCDCDDCDCYDGYDPEEEHDCYDIPYYDDDCRW